LQSYSFETLLFFDFSQEAFLITDAEKNILEVNQKFTEITGCQRDEIIGKTLAYLKLGRHDNAFYEDMWHSISNTGQWQGEVFDKRKNGEIYPKWLFIMAVHNQEKEVTHYLGIFSDVSERTLTERTLKITKQGNSKMRLIKKDTQANQGYFFDKRQL
jgi:PAS domain S-box-containing protein